MTDKQTKSQIAEKTEKNTAQIAIFVLAAAAVVVWGIRNPSVASRIVAVMLGFGGIVMIHEFGHFIVAKLGGIKVEAFSIGFPPVVVGIRKLKKGWRIRLLPKIGQPQHLEEGDDETEYQIGLIPVGGFVKMLGQSDSGAAEATDDPRSYANRPIWIRIATVAAGVVFNAIGAVIIFIILFMNGINLKPAMIGQVVPNSPAQEAGLRPGDEIVEVDGERFVDFEAVLLAPVLSVPGEPVTFVVREAGSGQEKTVKIVAEKQAGDSSNLRKMGISALTTLTIEPQIARSPELVEEIYKLTGLYPGDKVKAVNGQIVDTPWDFTRKVTQVFDSKVTLTVWRKWQSANGSEKLVDVDFPMQVGPVVENFRDEFDLAHFGRLVPRLKIEAVMEPTRTDALIQWFQTAILRRTPQPAVWDLLKAGDILLKVADVEYPNYKQLRELTTAYEGRPLPITVLRSGQQGDALPIEIVVTPKARIGSKRVMIGFAAGLDLENSVVGQVLPGAGQTSEIPAVPAGAVITAVNGQSVENFYQIAALLQKNAGQSIRIDYQFRGQAGTTTLSVDAYEPVHAQAMIAAGIPFEELTRCYKAANPAIAAQMGFKKAGQFVLRSYVTLGRLFQRSVPVSSLAGPVGILSMSYQVAGDSLAHYLYFLGLISSCLAVMNLLPLPVLDGGHIVLLLIEKITGRPIHERVLAPIMYAGMALLLGLILWVTYHDILRIVFG